MLLRSTAPKSYSVFSLISFFLFFFSNIANESNSLGLISAKLLISLSLFPLNLAAASITALFTNLTVWEFFQFFFSRVRLLSCEKKKNPRNSILAGFNLNRGVIWFSAGRRVLTELPDKSAFIKDFWMLQK